MIGKSIPLLGQVLINGIIGMWEFCPFRLIGHISM